MKVKLIDRNGNINSMDLFDLNSFCKSIYEEEINRCMEEKNIDKLEEYKKFTQKYKTFDPYFDFALFKLGYIYSSPFIDYNSHLKAKDDMIYAYKNMEDKEGKFWGYKCDDETLDIKEVNLDNINNCFIDGNGYSYGMEYGIHEGISNTILNRLILNNPDIADSFYELWEELDFNTRTPLLEIFGYLYASVDSRLKILLYNPILLTQRQREIIIYIKEYLYTYMIDYCKPNEDRKAKIKQFMKGVKYENR